MLVLGACLAATLPALAQWRATPHAAVVERAEGERFSVHRLRDGRVWATFELAASGTPTRLADAPLAVQVDDSPAEAVGAVSATVRRNTRSVSYRIWHGIESDGRSDFLQNLLNGERLVVRYAVQGQGRREAVFTLEGARLAISTALDIAPSPPPRRDTSLERNQAIKDDASCARHERSPADFLTCQDALSACPVKGQTEDQVRACVARAVSAGK